MGESTDWGLKVKIECPECRGSKFMGGCDYTELDKPCNNCNGTGKVITKVEPKNIEMFSNRPESREYTCACGKKEIILRPKLEQLPNGWINWSGTLLCDKCKTVVVFAALMAAANKVEQLKEKF